MKFFDNLRLYIFIIFFVLFIQNANNIFAIGFFDGLNNNDNNLSIEAEQIWHDDYHQINMAQGNVHIFYNKELMLGNRFIYDKYKDQIMAHGHIALRHTDGSVYFADKFNLSRLHYKGRIINFKGRLPNKSLIAANSVEMLDKDTYSMYGLAFSACKICQSNLVPYTPLWQIKAKKATLNRKTSNILYEDAYLELFGSPVLYIPYINMPAPGANRKSGFLIPYIRVSGQFGLQISTPYYFNIAPNIDATLTPILSTKKNIVYLGQFRHLLKNGEYEFNASITQTEKLNTEGNKESKSSLRGHIDARSNFKLNNDIINGHYGFKVFQVLDKAKTYLKKYKISDLDILPTYFYFNNSNYGRYTSIESITFQDLRPNHSAANTPAILPLIRSYHKSPTNWNNSVWDYGMTISNIRRNMGASYLKADMHSALTVPMSLVYGQLLNLKTSLYINMYKFKNNINQPENVKKTNHGIYPEVNLKWSWPLHCNIHKSNMILEPIVNLIISPKQNPKYIPDKSSYNEWQGPIAISSNNLFYSNRYLGTELKETGHRLNYGIKGSMSTIGSKNLWFTVGGSWYFNKNDILNNQLNSDFSGNKQLDYISSIVFQLTNNTFIANRLWLDSHNFEISRHEVNTVFQFPKWNLNLNYLDTSLKNMTQEDIYHKDIGASLWHNIYEDWWININVRSKLGKKIPNFNNKPREKDTRLIRDGIGLSYRGDCLEVNFIIDRNHVKLKDLKPSVSYIVNIRVPIFSSN